jgi:DNA excision repair protein ERCC-4
MREIHMRDMSAFTDDADEATQLQWAVGESIRGLEEEEQDSAGPSTAAGSSRKRSSSPFYDPEGIAGMLDTTAGIIDELNEQDQGPRPGFQDWMGQQGLLEDWDADYGLLSPADQVIIRPFGGDDDDIMLQELRPRFVVMYEPNLPFIRRLEVGTISWTRINPIRCTRIATQASPCACTR